MTPIRRVGATVVVLAVFVLLAGGAGWLLAERRGEQRDDATTERDAAVGAAEQVIDCINDPAATPEQCEDEADDAQETLEERVPPTGLTERQRREVMLLAAEAVAADPDLSVSEVVDRVLAELPEPEQGERGRPGVDGADGRSPTAAEVRALVEQVYAANPPPPGTDGADGSDGSDGKDGSTGPRGERGEQGPAPTDAQLDAAVARYCSVRGECVGATGDQGPKGDTGDPGPVGPAGPAGADGQNPVCPDGSTPTWTQPGRPLDDSFYLTCPAPTAAP